MSAIFRTADAWHLRKSLIYSTCSEFQRTEEEKLAQLNSIRSTDGVLDANNVSVYCLSDPSIDESNNLLFVNYSDTLLKDMRYELTEGSYSSMDQKNQVILPARYQKYLNVGDTVTGYIIDESDFDGSKNSQANTRAIPIPVSVTVAGFLAEQLTLNPGSGQSLDSLFTSHTGSFTNEIENEYGIASDICDANGSVVPAEHTNLFLIRTDGSVSPDKVEENLSAVVESPFLLKTGNELIEEYIDANKEEIGETISLGITAAVLAFSILISSTLLEVNYRRKEMATLYLCGAPWSKCIWTVLAVYIMPFLIGFPIGLFLFAKSANRGMFFILQPRLDPFDVLTTLAMEALFLALAILPFRFSAKFKTPYELFRKD